jgi:hypothetical protein
MAAGMAYAFHRTAGLIADSSVLENVVWEARCFTALD